MNRREIFKKFGLAGLFGLSACAVGEPLLTKPVRIPIPPETPPAQPSTGYAFVFAPQRFAVSFSGPDGKQTTVEIMNKDLPLLAEIYSELLARAGIPHDIISK